MSRLRSMGDWYLQTRHPYARLIARTMLPDWNSPSEFNFAGGDPNNLLHVRPDRWGHAVLRLDYCDCCTSPGYLEIRNKAGQACMEMRAPSELAMAEFMKIGLEFAVWSSTAPVRSKNGSSVMPKAVDSPGPKMHISWLVPLCEQAAALGLCLKWRLLCHESDHVRYFAPVRVDVTDSLLTVKGRNNQSCQLFLPAGRELRLANQANGTLLAVVAEDESLILSLEAAMGAADGPRWRSLVDAFLRQADRS